MTIEKRIKEELFSADINYYDALDRYKAEFPYGSSFCGETVSSKAASMYSSLQRTEGVVTGLSYLVESEIRGEELEAECRRLIHDYNNAETVDEVLAAEQAYYALYTIRS